MLHNVANAQQQRSLEWHDAKGALGICETDTANVYHRLPAYLQPLITKGAWNQSVRSAGEYLHFRTTARHFRIKFVIQGKSYAMPHMPATGVAGVDLYAKDANGAWNWSPPFEYRFGDTCVYNYRPVKVIARGNTGTDGMADYYLYLPLYSILEWISVGTFEGERFEYLGEDADQPIVAYGTSIMQGAVASRPGMAWTNMLSRRLGREVKNIGLSGNGRYEGPIFDLMSGVNARLYILDCMPNLTGFSPDTVEKRLRYGIAKLQEAHPDIPILLAEHADGNPDFEMDTTLVNKYHRASVTVSRIYDKLKAEGVKHIYLLTEKEIGLDINSTVEGTHPNDIGMMKYALAYEKKIRKILNEPAGDISTQMPVEQYRDGYDWRRRHEEVMAAVRDRHPSAIIFGNSIINYWGGEPKPEKAAPRGQDSWEKYMGPASVQNAGFGYDRIENVLWRIYHGELDDFTGSAIIVNIGTNNLGLNTDDEILEGLDFLVKQIRLRRPDATLYLGGILPRRAMLGRVLALNPRISKVATANGCKYFDLSKRFLKGNALNDALFLPDGLHPNAKGYALLGEGIQQLLQGKLK
ncbi:SGNH/GDSL hydrolase family protein [Compostibacter hankyongensis]|uniref:SGNH/GDSL hydrolase family protein n=2 Tax=Compostibacter hankyongensis TaxID=1007089 RepID=A0ABP8G6D2_9BACT